MIYLDTHVIVWLYAGVLEKFSSLALEEMELDDLVISPMVQLELTYLHEAKKITHTAPTIIKKLQQRIDIQVCDTEFEEIINKADTLTFTRDPFDRIIVAQAACHSAKLITKDRIIRKHYKHALWD